MAVATSYTEAGLKIWLIQELGAMATHLSWTVDTFQIGNAIDGAIYAMNDSSIDDVADVSGLADIRKLMALAKYEAWHRVVIELSVDESFKADGIEMGKDVLENAKAMLGLAQKEVAQIGTMITMPPAIVRPTESTRNPYGVEFLEQRADDIA